VSETTVNTVAATLLNVTVVAPVNPVPVITTGVAIGPLVGENALIVGSGTVTVKAVGLTGFALGVNTWMVPVVAPTGTVALT
jgi:hypothetical protein